MAALRICVLVCTSAEQFPNKCFYQEGFSHIFQFLRLGNTFSSNLSTMNLRYFFQPWWDIQLCEKNQQNFWIKINPKCISKYDWCILEENKGGLILKYGVKVPATR